MSRVDCPECPGWCPRVAARRVLVRHLTEQNLRQLPFPELLGALLDGLTDAGLIAPHLLPAIAPPPAPVPIPRPRPAVPGIAVRAARTEHGWSQSELARRAGIPHQTLVSRIERDLTVPDRHLRAVLGALELTEES